MVAEQMGLFDRPMPVVENGFDRGMKQSALAARARWSIEQQQAVDEAIGRVAMRLGEFTSEDVWRALGEGFPVSKGMASRLNACARRGSIENTGRVGRATRGGPHDHGQRLSIWRVLS